jgi:hypothetical protein
MKIAIVSVFTPNYDVALERCYARALQADGHEVTTVSLRAQGRRLPRGLVDIDEVLQYRRRQPSLLREVIASAPDLVLVVKGRGLFAETVSAWRKQGLKVINVFPDNPFEGAAAGLAGWSLLAQFRALDRVFVHDRFAVGQLRQLGIRADFLTFAYDPLSHHPVRDPDRADAIVFVGNPDRERIRYLRAVADLGLVLYGQWDWARLSPSDPLAACVRGGTQVGAAMAQRLGHARISLNILRLSQKTAHNMRTFEAPACGVCCLSEASVGVEEIFARDREVAVFHSPEELRHAALRLLESREAIDAIAEAGYARAKDETYARRAREVLAAV